MARKKSEGIMCWVTEEDKELLKQDSERSHLSGKYSTFLIWFWKTFRHKIGEMIK